MVNCMKRTLKYLQQAMNNAENYESWRAAAMEYDRLAGLDEWKEDDASPFYDYPLIRLRLNELREARDRNDVNQLIFNLHEGLHGNLGNIANPALYNVAKIGTKKLITDYLDEVTTSLTYLCDNEFECFSFSQKLDFFKATGQAYGRSALMLSGGAALGLFHLGVIKALWEQKLIPTVVSGSSAGSILAGVVGTHNDEELEQFLDPDYIFLEAFKMVGWKGVFNGKSLLDGDHLEMCLEKNVKNLTFEEAYNHSGRLINIPVSPYDAHQESRLLNARTSPNVLVQKASLASCAIPGVFSPVTLWAKNVKGEMVPYIPSRKWVDGSIKDDMPIRRLSRLFGVNHTIVSQTNPHVVPFISRKERDDGIIKFARKLVFSNIGLNAHIFLDTLRKHMSNTDLALLVDKAHSVLSQDYNGDINIVPPRQPLNLLRILKNPTKEDVLGYIAKGESQTWPKLEMIRNTTQISRTFEICIRQLRDQEERRLRGSQLYLVS